MEEVQAKEKDMQSILQVSSFLLDKNSEVEKTLAVNSKNLEVLQTQNMEYDSKIKEMLCELAEKNKTVEALEKESVRYEVSIKDYKDQINVKQSKIRELLDDK